MPRTLTLPLTQGHPIVNATISPTSALALALARSGQQATPPLTVQALLDTGAHCTCVDTSLRKALGLRPYRIRNVGSPGSGSPISCYQYKIALVVLHPSGSSQDNLIVPALAVLELHVANMGLPIEVLIGCDVLAACRLCYDGPQGIFTLAY